MTTINLCMLCPQCNRINYMLEQLVKHGDCIVCWNCLHMFKCFSGTSARKHGATFCGARLRIETNSEEPMDTNEKFNQADPNTINLSETISKNEIEAPVKPRHVHDMERAREIIRGLYRTVIGLGQEPNREWAQELNDIASRQPHQIALGALSTLIQK